jgi:hypothetical protein
MQETRQLAIGRQQARDAIWGKSGSDRGQEGMQRANWSFSPQYGGSMLIQNVSGLILDYMGLHL